MRLMCLLLIISCVATSYSSRKVELWNQTEITLKSSKCYDNPFIDVEITALFINGDGDTIRRPAFWDGDNIWKVRFAPVKTGRWEYKTFSNIKDDPAFETSGSIDAVKYKGDIEVFKKGFVKISGNKRFFVYNNGDPFFYLADTHWFLPLEKWDECNEPGCTSQFKYMADKRAEQNFSVYQVQTNGCKLVEDSVTSVDLNAFRDIDRKFDYLVNKGFIINTSIGSAHNYAMVLGIKGAERLARYWVARYGAYPVIWMTAQEVDLDKHKYLDTWKAAALTINKYDDYHHPHSAHLWDNSNSSFFDNDKWHNFNMVQGGHIIWGGGTQTKSFYESYYTNNPVKPFLESEANYENLGKEKQCTTEDIRNAAYKSILCGSLGFGYGVQGIWQNCYTPENCGCCTDWGIKTWYEGLTASGGTQMEILRKFFSSIDWFKLEPRFDNEKWIEINTNIPEEKEKVVLSSVSSNKYLLYLYSENNIRIKLKQLDPGAEYEAEWFDPQNGKYLTINDLKVSGKTEIIVPVKPSGEDFIFVLSKKN